MSFLSTGTLFLVIAAFIVSSVGGAKLLVGYRDNQGHSNILNYMDSQGDVEIIEVMDYKYTRPQRVSPVDNDNNVMGAAQIIYTQDDATMSTGFSILEFDKDDVQSDMIPLSGIDGVVSVEQDGEGSFFDPITIQEEGAGEPVSHLAAETTPYGITLVKSAFINAQPDPVGATPITICVVDSGYALGHEDLPNSTHHGVSGYSPYSDDQGEPWDDDYFGHGTHVAGTIGAIGGNNIGITSVNPDPNKFRFFIGKLKSFGFSHSDVLRNLAQCVDNGARVINMSFRAPYSSIFSTTMVDLYDSDVLLIAAAGNSANSFPPEVYPASFKTVVSVAAVDSNQNRAIFSQINDQVELTGPGVDVESTFPPQNYRMKEGTSFASPHVAGVASLLRYHYPNCTNNQIRNVMLLSAEDLGTSGWDNEYGWGLINAEEAYNLLNDQGCKAGGPLPEAGTTLSDQALGGKDQRILTFSPTSVPSSTPSSNPSESPHESPSSIPSDSPSSKPSDAPSSTPSSSPSFGPSDFPSSTPSSSPSEEPSESPSLQPSTSPSASPSQGPSAQPSSLPSASPSLQPSSTPSSSPSDEPSAQPSSLPSASPSLSPTDSFQPSSSPSDRPSYSGQPSSNPSIVPSSKPSSRPSITPTISEAPSLFQGKAGKVSKARQTSKAPKVNSSIQAGLLRSSGHTSPSLGNVSLTLIVVVASNALYFISS